MLDSLPPEIIEQILGHLPTASSLANVARTNRKLHTVLSADSYAIFRNFVQKAFPSINTPPLWQDMACALTSRSRAWDRKSFVARECHPPVEESAHVSRAAYQKFGYIPVIDSYEQWSGNCAADRKQVLTYGAGGRLRLRVTEKGRTQWRSLQLPDDHLGQNDILDVHLLRPHQHQNLHGETVIVRRANRQVMMVESGVGENNLVETLSYLVDGAHIDCLDISTGTDPVMVVCNTKALQLFPVNAATDVIRPASVRPLAHNFSFKHRKRAVKFLDDNTIATSVQFVEGRERAPILIYNVSQTSISALPFQPSCSIDIDHSLKGRHSANVIVKLDDTASFASRPGQVFLSGWTDGIIRLHDLRTPLQAVNQYVDFVDDGQILSLAPVGHERFYAGSHQNACLKIFDMRMPGARAYSYINALPRSVTKDSATTAKSEPILKQPRETNIFLALTVQRNRLWAPLPRQQSTTTNLPRYRGSIYSLSTPSPSSPTLFAGIENHVIQLDFANTDDILRKHKGLCGSAAGLSTLTARPEINDVLSLSCYERPREGHASTDPVLLRKQVDWHEVVRGIDKSQYGPLEEGWDHRWRMTHSWKTRNGDRRWRRG